MGRYFILQCKRLAKAIPGVLLVLTLLLGGLFLAWQAMVRMEQAGNDSEKIRIGMVGTAEDTMLQLGMSVLADYDSTQMSMEMVPLTQEEAHRQLGAGTISAYVVIPEGFVDQARYGTILPLQFVSTTGAAGLVTIFKGEVTQVISQLILRAQQGVYGLQSAMYDANLGNRGNTMTNLCIDYVDNLLGRDKVYTMQELGIAGGLELGEYLLTGLAVLLLLLACLPFAPRMIRQDRALGRILAARGRSAIGQALTEFAAYTLAIAAAVGLLLSAALLLGAELPGGTVAALLPVVLLASTYSFCLYGMGGDLISGVLLQFLLTVALCFLSGCLYPPHFFPVSIQKLGAWLPTGMARNHLACVFSQGDGSLVGLLLYSGLFLAAGVALRVYRIREAKV